MPNNKVKISVCGIICTLLTDESEAYMRELAAEVEQTMEAMMGRAGTARRELAAVTAAMSYCDEARKLRNSKRKQEAEQPAVDAKAPDTLQVGETKELRNPLRPMDDCEQQGLVSFFEKS